MENAARLYVQSEVLRADLYRLVRRVLKGREVSKYAIACPPFELDVLDNPDRFHVTSDPSMEFLGYWFLIDIGARGRPTKTAWVDFLTILMNALHADGMTVVAACDWEVMLPGEGTLVSQSP